jgi:hypothetical protein
LSPWIPPPASHCPGLCGRRAPRGPAGGFYEGSSARASVPGLWSRMGSRATRVPGAAAFPTPAISGADARCGRPQADGCGSPCRMRARPAVGSGKRSGVSCRPAIGARCGAGSHGFTPTLWDGGERRWQSRGGPYGRRCCRRLATDGSPAPTTRPSASSAPSGASRELATASARLQMQRLVLGSFVALVARFAAQGQRPQTPHLEHFPQTVRYQMWTRPNMSLLRPQLCRPQHECTAPQVA